MFHDHINSAKSSQDLAAMGTEAIAYMREMTSEEIMAAFPLTPNLDPERKYWALFGADGSPLVLADDQQELASSAFYNNLQAILPS